MTYHADPDYRRHLADEAARRKAREAAAVAARAGVPVRFLGRCGRCKRPAAIDVPTDGRAEPYVTAPARILWPESKKPDELIAVPFWEAARAGHFTCQCGAPIRHSWKRVEGRLVEAVRCGARCTGATGPSCDCSCGGKNHGASHL